MALMLETAAALVLGHCLADFVLQSDAMVRHKARTTVLLTHTGIVALASWAALGFAPVPLLILLVAASHFVIDGLKIRHGGPGFAAFAADQAAHLAMIALAAALVPGAWTQGLWTLLATGPLGAWMPRLPQGGQLIGRLERLMILMLVLAEQPDGIGLLIAAKSILRFNEHARDAGDRRASEYVIIGTLASFAWAIGTAWATMAVLRALAP